MVDEIKNISNFDRLIHEPARLAILAVLSACESADFTGNELFVAYADGRVEHKSK